MYYPDGTNHETEAVDLSIFLFEALASKIDSLDNDGKELYNPLVEDYSIPSAPALQTLKEIEPVWCSRHSNLHDILVYMQHDTAVSRQVSDVLNNLQTLKQDTKDRVKTRVLTTRLLNDWHKEMNHINANQEPDGRKIHTNILEREVNSFSDIFRSCAGISNMEDVIQSLEDVIVKITDLKRETTRLDIKKAEKEAEYQSFQRETRRAIEDERKTREADVEHLEEEIKDLCESMDELASKVRRHDGNILDLNESFDKFIKDKKDLLYRLSRLESEVNKHDMEIDKIIDKVCYLLSKRSVVRPNKIDRKVSDSD
ncbi:hypothetical protein [Cardinium endosymbiont of Dermatophagoides farinae]|uniref:hypothetical protein n=1 Tax=Cardinium endosymbiont of Dermatophagoides farinae TaxID=2597823 RepID=UPI001184519C|nr:hypothetical protein [Cardinium endosymbiont of Dermatophagoides farinae]TSJ81153.1 hypothetical protein FPG78_04050 [Cardinium endosymbiont of Dermatophagoides farinae]